MDPKQQETFNRVMTTSTPVAAEQPATPAPAQNPFSQPEAPKDPQAQAPIEESSVRPNPPMPTAVVPPTGGAAVATPMPNPLPSPATATAQRATNMSPMLQALYIIAALVFFIVYTIFWIKIFNLSTPLPF